MSQPFFRPESAALGRLPFVTPIELGRSTPAATTDTLVYTVPGGAVAQVQLIRIAQRSGGNAIVRVYHDTTGTPGATDEVISGATVASGTPYSDTGLLNLDSGDRLYVRSDIADVNFFIYGIEISR